MKEFVWINRKTFLNFAFHDRTYFLVDWTFWILTPISTCTCFYTRGLKMLKVWSVYCSSDLDESFYKEFLRKILFRKMHWVINVLSWERPKLKEIKILMFFIFHPILKQLFFCKMIIFISYLSDIKKKLALLFWTGILNFAY